MQGSFFIQVLVGHRAELELKLSPRKFGLAGVDFAPFNRRPQAAEEGPDVLVFAAEAAKLHSNIKRAKAIFIIVGLFLFEIRA